jgi:pyridoxal phosphate enzyme (YggS family)
MIGHLQRNKIRTLLPHARIIHSLDSDRLAEALDRHAGELGAAVDVLLEVNIAGERSKTGVPPAAVAALAERVAGCPHLRLRGLMTLAPYHPEAEASRPHFAGLRALLSDLRARGAVGPDCVHLSMGMSQDYAVAVEEGATFVRVGSLLFAGLPGTDPRGREPGP